MSRPGGDTHSRNVDRKFPFMFRSGACFALQHVNRNVLRKFTLTLEDFHDWFRLSEREIWKPLCCSYCTNRPFLSVCLARLWLAHCEQVSAETEQRCLCCTGRQAGVASFDLGRLFLFSIFQFFSEWQCRDEVLLVHVVTCEFTQMEQHFSRLFHRGKKLLAPLCVEYEQQMLCPQPINLKVT